MSSERTNMRRHMHKTSRRRPGPRPMRNWLSIRVELVEGRGEHYWPRPGRLFAAAKSHSYAQLATAIDVAFARWDRSHLHEFQLTDGTRIGTPNPEWDNEGVLEETRETLSRLQTSHTCAPSMRALIRLTLSVSFPTPPCHTSVGGTSRINMGGLGLEATPNLRYRWIQSYPTCHRYDQGGDPVASTFAAAGKRATYSNAGGKPCQLAALSGTQRIHAAISERATAIC